MKRSWKIAAFAAFVVFAAAAAAFVAVRVTLAAQPEVSERWALYIENLKPEQKIVVLSSRQRYAASKEFSAMLLAIIKIKASIEVTAWADVFYYVDASDSSRWAISWDKKERSLVISAPEPDCLPPSVHTDTIEVTVKGANLVTKTVFRLREEAAKMEKALSADLAAQARASLGDEAVRNGVREGIAAVGRSFCAAAFGVKPAAVIVRLAGD